MDWSQAFTVIGVFVGGFVYMMSKMDANKKDVEQKIDNKISALDQKIDILSARSIRMEEQIKSTNQRIDDFKHEVNQRLSTIEGYLVPKKVFHFEEPKDEEPKEN